MANKVASFAKLKFFKIIICDILAVGKPNFANSPEQSPQLQGQHIDVPLPLSDPQLNDPAVKRARLNSGSNYLNEVEAARMAGNATLNDVANASVYATATVVAEVLPSIGRNINQAVAQAIIQAIGPMLDQRFLAVTNQMNLMNGQLTLMNGRLNQMALDQGIPAATTAQLRAVHQNGFVERNEDVIQQVIALPTIQQPPANLPNALPQLVPPQPVPPIFPATKAHLLHLAGDEINLLLAYYHLALDGTVAFRRSRLAGYLGLPPLR